MSMFDPNAFLNSATTEALERRPPLPTENPEDPNGLYTAILGEVTIADGIIGKGDRAGQPWVQLVVPVRVQVPGAVQDMIGGAKELTITDRPMLDITPQGQLDNSVGKNRGLRVYREATRMNVKGEPFAPAMLSGKVVRVKIVHEMFRESLNERIKEVFPA